MRLCYFFNIWASGELCFKDLLLGSPKANVPISDKLDIYDTFLPGPGRKSFTDLFIIAFTSCERNSSRLTFTPLHIQSMERCLFLTWGDSGNWKLAPVALCPWPHHCESKGTVPIAVTVTVPPLMVHKASEAFIRGFTIALWSFHSFTSARYMGSAFIEVNIVVLLPIYWLVVVFIHQTLFCIYRILALYKPMEIPQSTKLRSGP